MQNPCMQNPWCRIPGLIKGGKWGDHSFHSSLLPAWRCDATKHFKLLWHWLTRYGGCVWSRDLIESLLSLGCFWSGYLVSRRKVTNTVFIPDSSMKSHYSQLKVWWGNDNEIRCKYWLPAHIYSAHSPWRTVLHPGVGSSIQLCPPLSNSMLMAH